MTASSSMTEPGHPWVVTGTVNGRIAAVPAEVSVGADM
jgi:hypothetical protein